MENRPIQRESIPLIGFERALPQDIDAYMELERVAANTRTYTPATPEDALKELENNTVFFIKDGERVIGRVAYNIKSPGHAYISDLIIHPEYRERGIGRTAIENILEQLAGMKQIDLVTNPGNSKAIALYESFGFVQGGLRQNYFGDGEDLVEMTLHKI